MLTIIAAPSNAGRRSAIIAGFAGHFTTHCWALDASQSFPPYNAGAAAEFYIQNSPVLSSLLINIRSYSILYYAL